MAGNVSKSMEKVKTSTGGAQKAVDSLLKRFIGFEMAMKAMRGMVDSLKEFEKASGGNTLSKLTDQFGQLQVEIGSVLMPVLQEFSAWWAANETEILDKARNTMNILIFVGSTIKEALTSAFNLVKIAFGVLVEFLTNGWARIARVLSKVPGLSGLSGLADELEMVNKAAIATVEEGAQGIAGAADRWNAAIDKLGEGTKASGFKYVSDAARKRLDAAKKEQEERLKIIEDGSKKVLEATNMYSQAVNDIVYKLEESRLHRLKSSSVLQYEELEHSLSKEAEAFDNDTQEFISGFDRVYQAASNDFGAVQKVDRMVLSFIQFREELKKLSTETQKNQLNNFGDKLLGDLDKNVKSSQEDVDELSKKVAQSYLDVIEAEIALANANENVTQQIHDNANLTIDDFSKIVDAINISGSAVMQWSQYMQSVVDKQTTAEKESARVRIMGKEKMTAKEAELQREYDRIDAEAARKRIALRKGELTASLAMAIANTAEGATKALGQGGTLGIVTMLAVIAAGAVQSGIIMDQLANVEKGYAKGGIVGGNQTTGDRNSIRANTGEMVLTGSQQRRLFDMATGRSGAPIVVHETYNVSGNIDASAARQIARDREKQLKNLREDLRELNYRGQMVYA